MIRILQIYSDAAAIQYAEAERLICVALAAKENADAIMNRCADLIAENLGPDGEWAFAEEEAPESEDIPW